MYLISVLKLLIQGYHVSKGDYIRIWQTSYKYKNSWKFIFKKLLFTTNYFYWIITKLQNHL